MNVSDSISRAADALEEAGVVEARRESSSLLAFVLQRDVAFLIAHPEYDLAANQKIVFEACVRRRAKHEPFQYITGRQEFYRLEFEVTPDVLIPRPETEILVERATEILSRLGAPQFCEIGVGSGSISVSILHSVENATAVGVDISESALAIARRNTEKHNLTDRLDLRQGDIFNGLEGPFDMIISNPPYVPVHQLDSLQAEVRDFEPRVALAGGGDGLDVIERIIAGAPEFLKPNGHLLLEVGFDQAERVEKLFDLAVWEQPDSLADLQQIPRIIMAGLR